jgi:hypothetical protein
MQGALRIFRVASWVAGGAFLLAAFVLIAYAVKDSTAFKQCYSNRAEQHRAQAKPENAPGVVVSVVDELLWIMSCSGRVANQNGSGITALFTVVLAVSTSLLWWETRKNSDAVLRQGAIIKLQQRAFVSGGGPMSRSKGDIDDVCMTIENYGHTPAFIKRIEWGLCPEADFPVDEKVSDLIDRKQVRVEPLDREDVLPPDAGTRPYRKARFRFSEHRGEIFFGRYIYEDVFGDPHHSTFKLRLGTGDKPSSEPLPGCYSDWS